MCQLTSEKKWNELHKKMLKNYIKTCIICGEKVNAKAFSNSKK